MKTSSRYPEGELCTNVYTAAINDHAPFTNPTTRLVLHAPPANPHPHSLHRAARIAGAVRLNEVQSAPVKWLWPGRIPLGRISLLVGDPGTGKSLVALDIAARVSSGTPWPKAGTSSEDRGTRSDLEIATHPSLLDPPRLRTRASLLDPRPFFRPTPHRRRRPRRHRPPQAPSPRRELRSHSRNPKHPRPNINERRPPHVRP